jgi:hypothetical protein
MRSRARPIAAFIAAKVAGPSTSSRVALPRYRSTSPEAASTRRWCSARSARPSALMASMTRFSAAAGSGPLRPCTVIAASVAAAAWCGATAARSGSAAQATAVQSTAASRTGTVRFITA